MASDGWLLISRNSLRNSASSAVRDYAVEHDGVWAWKGQDFEVMNRLFEKGYILDPRNKTKSVFLAEKGLARSKELFEELFRKKKAEEGN